MQTPTHKNEEHTVPAVHALHLAEVAKRFGVAADALFAELGATEGSLSTPNARLTVRDLEKLVVRARALTGESAIGVHFGMQMRASAHGYLGFAAMTASTVRDALEIATRFVPTRTNALSLGLHVEGGMASLVIDERADFGAARDAVLLALVVGIWQIGNALTGRELDGSADFAFPRPEYFDRFAAASPRSRFDRPANQLVFDAAVLDLPITMADRVSRQLALEQCERSLEALGLDGEVLARVRTLVLTREHGARSLEQVAAAVHLSPRTLKRKLAMSGVTYSELLEEQRRETALLLLRSATLSLDDVAEQLGYSDVANFSRAFRRWTGVSPGAYRRG